MKETGRGPGQPDSKDDVINKYGTYEVQRTNGTENDYPQIAQGLSKEKKKELEQQYHAWYRRPNPIIHAPDSRKDD